MVNIKFYYLFRTQDMQLLGMEIMKYNDEFLLRRIGHLRRRQNEAMNTLGNYLKIILKNYF